MNGIQLTLNNLKHLLQDIEVRLNKMIKGSPEYQYLNDIGLMISTVAMVSSKGDPVAFEHTTHLLAVIGRSLADGDTMVVLGPEQIADLLGKAVPSKTVPEPSKN